MLVHKNSICHSSYDEEKTSGNIVSSPVSYIDQYDYTVSLKYQLSTTKIHQTRELKKITSFHFKVID